MNKVIEIGNLTKDPELKTVGDKNTAVCTFSIAVNAPYNDKNGDQVVDFFNVEVWGKRGENCAKYLNKGSKVAVVGELKNNNYTDKDGKTVYGNKIKADEVDFLSSKPQSAATDAGTQEAPVGDMPF